MAYDKELYAIVDAEYEELQRQNKQDLEERKLVVYSRIPEIEEIEDEIKTIGLKIVKLAISGENINYQVKLLRDKQKALLIKRKALLLENGFSDDELSMRFMCDKCKDTGIYNDRNCECFMRRLILKSFHSSNLSSQLRDQSFKTIDMNVYSKEIDEKYGVSPYEYMSNIIKISKNFVEQFDVENQNLLFWGEPGVGKTFLSTCIAKELIKKSKTVIYETTYKIFSMLEDYKFKRTENIERLRLDTEKLYQCDLLILDDLGTEFATSYTNAALFDILNSRLITNKRTIINTNLNMEELSKKYSDRVISRLAGHYLILQFIGDDIRLKKCK